MVDITAFKALKYNPEKISSLSRVVSLPYDVISPKMQDEYYSLSKKKMKTMQAGFPFTSGF